MEHLDCFVEGSREGHPQRQHRHRGVDLPRCDVIQSGDDVSKVTLSVGIEDPYGVDGRPPRHSSLPPCGDVRHLNTEYWKREGICEATEERSQKVEGREEKSVKQAIGRERERDRQTDRQTDRERERVGK